MATSYKDLNDMDNALKNYLLSLKYDNNNPIRYFRLALLYAHKENDYEAIEYSKQYFNK
jgi:hypothetical protein